MVESTAKLRKDVLAATGVDILEDDKKTFRSTYDIILDISKVWGDIDNQITKAAILEELAGKRNANALSAILNNGEMLKSVYDDAIDSSGVAIAEQQKWADSIEAKFSKIEGIFQSISTNILSSDSFKNILDSLTSIMEKLESITKSGNGLIPIVTTISTLMTTAGGGLINVNQIKSARSVIDSYNSSLLMGTERQNAFMQEISLSNPSMYTYLNSLNGAEASMRGYATATAATTAKTIGLRVATLALNAVVGIGLGLAIGALTTGITKLINRQKELRQEFADSAQEMKSNMDALDDYKAKVLEVADSDKTEADKLKELGDIKDELHDKYRTEINDINDVTQARVELTDAIDKQRRKELDSFYRENQKEFEKQTRITTIDTGGDGGYWQQEWRTYFTDINNVRDDIQNLFEDFYTDGTDAIFSVNFGDTLDDYYNNLTAVSDRMGEIRSRSQDWNKDEEKIYKQINKLIEDIKDEYYGEDHLMESIINDADSFAERLLLMNPKESTQSLEEWKLSLEELARQDKSYGDGITFVVKAIDSLVDSMADEEKQVEYVDDAFSSLEKNLAKIESQTQATQSAIVNADEALKDLLSVTEQNNDADKFFTSSEIIELLNKYPELYNSILETASGYKIEKEALDALRESKIQEQKDAINAQILETEALYNATEQKLEAYKSEMASVKDLATAKLELAEIENQIAIAQKANMPGAGNMRNLSNLLGKKQALEQANNYYTAKESLNEYSETISKLKTQLQVLGTAHEKAADSAKVQTDAINKQKEAHKELQDEMKNAQKSIQDLLELTMSMIKKNSEKQKDALKEELDGFKKVIDKQKELIDLQKESSDYDQEMKEANLELLKIKQELDALSIEGATYSLDDIRRRNELAEQLNKAETDRDKKVADRQVEIRKNALDKEAEIYENNINTQIKSIEDYLSKEGKIREDAINLINGKTQDFYNDLLNYTVTYTTQSQYEFQTLWENAYAAIMKYGNGQLDVAYVLDYLSGQLVILDAEIKTLESSASSAKNSLVDMANQASGAFTRLNNEIDKSNVGLANFKNTADIEYELRNAIYAKNNNSKTTQEIEYEMRNKVYSAYKNLPKHHTGGIVGGETSRHAEVLAKLLNGEVVVTEGQARNFMANTLPKLSGQMVTNNNTSSVSPVIQMGDIIIQGNADNNTVVQLKKVQQSIVDDVFQMINKQTKLFNGGKIR